MTFIVPQPQTFIHAKWAERDTFNQYKNHKSSQHFHTGHFKSRIATSAYLSV